jgi:sulfatase modifying factor 1
MHGDVRTLNYTWRGGDIEHELRLVPVTGTGGGQYLFGAEPNRRPIEMRNFHMTSTPVTQALWTHVMGSNPATRADLCCPVENVSWDQIRDGGGFLERINSSEILDAVAGPERTLRFRLPSETEWEYAARGGPHWTDGFAFSGSNSVDAVAWYGRRFSRVRRLGVRALGWRIGWRLFSKGNLDRPSRTHEVATKAPNQLGLYDMCGNVWEWCEDGCVDDVDAVPRDGTPWRGPGPGRRLRGGCHHNWDIHCTVWFRYGIAQNAHDGCIGFRLVLAPV